ncbi:carboxymuconolactone decarboxylase family protein [Xenorhabdus innexi]|uniref:4-carboxymuconolactone decarboxylase n=1 Tax=Xenorhabdus innexi TaxID=290109 RepID=A0A1N6MXZ1_9GAMM|nr:carboxymuconolactone decarboxylase family protein [Xenorhabdus innexi]PHM31211.1 alkylhydroperoxidase [Xenorhabdus innexi]SIP73647.1 4-carboxymuconolactone decarboxylase [Xenorhabdus innexi]
MARVSLVKTFPNIYQQLRIVNDEVDKSALSAGLTEGFCHLLKLRISQINGCAYCVRLHTRDALQQNVSIDKIALLPAWQETEYFTEQERAALLLVEAITEIQHDHIPDDIYQKAAALWSDTQVAAIEWLAIMMNALNRLGIAGRYHVAP